MDPSNLDYFREGKPSRNSWEVEKFKIQASSKLGRKSEDPLPLGKLRRRRRFPQTPNDKLDAQ